MPPETVQDNAVTDTTPPPATTGPKTTRDAIRDAVKEVRTREDPARKPERESREEKPKIHAIAALRGAVKDTATDKDRDPTTGRFASKDGETQHPAAARAPDAQIGTEAAAPAPTSSDTNLEAPAGSEPAAQSGPPRVWSKEAKAQWASLPPAIQQEILRSETSGAKGVEKLKLEHQEQVKRYQPIEQAVAPHRARYHALGMSDAQAIHQLMAWNEALSRNPQQVLPELARAFGVDLSTLARPAPQGQAGESQPGTAGAASPQAGAETPPWLTQLTNQFGQVVQRVNALSSQSEQEKASRVQADIQGFAQSKNPDGSLKHPHFERLKQTMGQLMQAGLVKDGDLEAAYAKAARNDDEVWGEMQRETEEKAERDRLAQEAKRKADANAAAEKRRVDEEAKRNASVSPRGSSPAGDRGSGKSAKKPHSHSVRDSLIQARKELAG